MFCPNCGASTEGKFCEKCGAAVDAGAASSTGPGYTGSTGAGAGANAPPVLSAPGLPMNIASALCYVPIIFPIIFLLVNPYKRDRTVRFSAFQSLFLTLSLFVLNELVGLLLGSNWETAYTMYRVLRLAEFILILFLAFKAFQNEKVLLPGIGPLAQKQA
ncbi:MAG: hypothetical protein M3Z36_14165 [Acidobacteriota bacterium]|nr:hypothetical protein [Acidobacteriota bacterium]